MSNKPKDSIRWTTDILNILEVDDYNHCLAILDCCYAGLAETRTVAELLAASSWREQADDDEHVNFTMRLDKELRSLAGGPPASTAATVYARMSAHSTSFDHAQPIHVMPLGDKSSIVFESHGKGGAAESLPTIQKHARGAVVTIGVTIAKSETVPSAHEFEKWAAANIPRNLQCLKIRAQWGMGMGERRVLLTMPTEIFTCLEDRPEYEFDSHGLSDSFGTLDEDEVDKELAEDDGEAMPLGRRSINIPEPVQLKN